MKNENGQALLLVLLAMAVLATVALSVSSRSITEIGVTTREEESLRAFSAAEAGVEQGLVTGSPAEIAADTVPSITKNLEAPSESGTSTVSTFTAEVDRYPENLTQFAYPFKLLSGQAGTVSLVTRGENGEVLPCSASSPCFSGNSLTLCWGDPSVTTETPAAVVSIIYRNASGAYAKATVGYDPNSPRRQVGVSGAPANNFTPPNSGNCTIAGQSYSYRTGIDFGSLGISGTPVLMRVSMLYNETAPHVFGVSTASNLPIQGRKVSSEGRSGEVTRKIDAFLLNPEMPYIFDTALYSSADITK